MAISDKSPLEEGYGVQQPQLIADYERNSASPTVIERSPAEQEDALMAVSDISANTGPQRFQRATEHTSLAAPIPPTPLITKTVMVTTRR
jgi:hypothetical protein